MLVENGLPPHFSDKGTEAQSGQLTCSEWPPAGSPISKDSAGHRGRGWG